VNTGDLIPLSIATGILLILSGVIFMVGGMLYAGRAIWKWPAGATAGYLLLERGFVMAALVTLALGFTLLERVLEAAGSIVLAPTALVIFLLGAVLALAAETFFLSKQEWLYAPIVVFVILSFLAQAVFGGALLRTGLLPGWVGWASILWSLAWLVILPIARPKDIYYPWIHYTAPLLIGIALLGRG
jgi:hypothetical protein